MSQASLLDGVAITGLDTVPASKPTAGEHGEAYDRTLDDFVTALTADTTASVYRILRIPSNSKVKRLLLNTAALSASTTLNVGLAYSDAPVSGTPDGTPPALAGTIINATLFAAAVAATSANVDTNVSPPIQSRSTQLWSYAGLSADPGGYFDIIVQPAVAVVAGGVIGLQVGYAD